jgi:transcriptional regulator with XRE-family HTH domain
MDAPDLGDLIRSERKKQCLTQTQLAEKAGVWPSVVSAFERGQKRRPEPKTVKKLFDALGLDYDPDQNYWSAKVSTVVDIEVSIKKCAKLSSRSKKALIEMLYLLAEADVLRANEVSPPIARQAGDSLLARQANTRL